MVKGLASILLMGMLAILTAQRVTEWHDNVSLWRSAVRVSPTARGWLNYGAALADAGDFDGAMACYRSAVNTASPQARLIQRAVLKNLDIVQQSDRRRW